MVTTARKATSPLTLQQVSGSTVAVFDDPAFVDTAPDSGDPWPESDMVQASLTNFGIPKITFTDFTQVLETSPVIRDSRAGIWRPRQLALPGPTMSAIRTFLNWGGTLVVHGSDANANASALLNAILLPGAPISEYFSNNQGTKTYTKTGALPASSFGG
jgi:hypothetical protein